NSLVSVGGVVDRDVGRVQDGDEADRRAVPVVEVVLTGLTAGGEHVLRGEICVLTVLGDVDHAGGVRAGGQIRMAGGEIAGGGDLDAGLGAGVVAVEISALQVEDRAAVAGDTHEDVRRRGHLLGRSVDVDVQVRTACGDRERHGGAVGRRALIGRIRG